MSEPAGGSLLALLRNHADSTPDHPAILAPDRQSATYADLRAQVETVGAFLAADGIGRGAVVALALANGPDLAVAFLATAAAAVCAPLAPDRPVTEHRRDLERLETRMLIVARGDDGTARAAAADLGIPVAELTAVEPAGTFTLTGGSGTPTAPPTAPPDAGDAALLLFTSGTTSAPKLVPLTEAGLLASAATVAATLALGPDDRGLTVMPLFHIHGLVAGLLAPLHAGGSVVCTPGFSGAVVWDWIDAFAPTWYTAVPTIHQAMVDATRRRLDAGGSAASSLRFVRSSSAALPTRVLTDLETLLAVPVIEAYGMTEAAHQIASNPLPPGARVPGSVGRATGTEITVRDDAGVLPPGTAGEVVIRGPALATHYLGSPDATAAAFTDGWFRTGDQGVLDADGVLTLTGRLKEIINRGGEKVAPREIDEVLLAHPGVEHAVAFGVPHPRLGEEVAAAVVLRDGATVTGPQLRVFAAQQLASWKVPRRVVVLDEIPRGATGKLDRLGLPARLGLASAGGAHAAPAVPPADDTERALAAVWQDVLGDDALPSVTADFFELGGDSLHANELLEAIESAFGRRLPATVFLTHATIRLMADLLRGQHTTGTSTEPAVVPIQPGGTRPPLFGLMRAGSVVTLRHLAATLGPDQPLYGLWVPAMHTTADAGWSVEEIAATCTALVRDTQATGPYFLFGHSMGGVVCFELARRLHALGEPVDLLVLADAVNPALLRDRYRAHRTTRYRLRKLFSRKGPGVIAHRVRRVFGAETPPPREYLAGTEVLADLDAALARERAYHPGPAVGPVAVMATRAYIDWTRDSSLGWAPLLAEGWTEIEVPGDHDTMIGEPHVHVLAARLGEVLERAQAGIDLGRISRE